MSVLEPADRFVTRHLGPRQEEMKEMLGALELPSLGALMERAVPPAIRLRGELRLPPPRTETEVLARLRELAGKNRVYRSYLGLGYHDCVLPPVLQRLILENPGWYTQYTPYQSEIAQGRLEALLIFQTLTCDLTGLPVANASLLDEPTAAAEAVHLAFRARPKRSRARRVFLSARCHPQTLGVVRTRAEAQGWEVVVGDHEAAPLDETFFAALVQYPATDGAVLDYRPFAEEVHAAGALLLAACDPLALVLLPPPAAWGADVAVGSMQRFGVPPGYGGPHAAFFAARREHLRRLPGRIVGVSRDRRGAPAYRLALATREQHIRRAKATSNICTAQVLPAVVAAMYAVYHGPEGLRRIARRVHRAARILEEGVRALGYGTPTTPVFDTLRIRAGARRDAVLAAARRRGINLRPDGPEHLVVALDETVTDRDLADLLAAFGLDASPPRVEDLAPRAADRLGPTRTDPILTHPVFHRYRSEAELTRYLKRLEGRDLSLTTSMIPLGSCTMKLNATATLLPMTWREFARLHPFAPLEQAAGYQELLRELAAWLGEITGLPHVSFQPNSGAQGELTGLLVIRAFHRRCGEAERRVCLIPASAHGTNPASAALAGLDVVEVACDDGGNIDVEDLRRRAEEAGPRLAALMVTYPSTHGVFEAAIMEICRIVHAAGGQVYLDGANLNALVGVARLADLGADVCHVNLHKTFAIPHGGGGPGMGPICVADHLAPFLPRHPLAAVGGEEGIGPVAGSPWGSAMILPIPYAYIALLGAAGLKRTAEVAVLNANYLARRLEPHYRVLYKGPGGFVAHEFILDTRPLKERAGVRVEDIAKRLMDYGFHAPTMSFPVPGTLMIEPTESESKAELDRFAAALARIRAEVAAIERGEMDRERNPLKLAPHTYLDLADPEWDRPYTREAAALPAPWLREHKFWPPVGRIDNVWGDRNFLGVLPEERPVRG